MPRTTYLLACLWYQCAKFAKEFSKVEFVCTKNGEQSVVSCDFFSVWFSVPDLLLDKVEQICALQLLLQVNTQLVVPVLQDMLTSYESV